MGIKHLEIFFQWSRTFFQMYKLVTFSLRPCNYFSLGGVVLFFKSLMHLQSTGCKGCRNVFQAEHSQNSLTKPKHRLLPGKAALRSLQGLRQEAGFPPFLVWSLVIVRTSLSDYNQCFPVSLRALSTSTTHPEASISS